MTVFLLLCLLAPEDVALVNPGFEDGATGWNLPRTYRVDDTVAHTGRASLRVENTDPGTYLLAGQPVQLTAGARYRFSVWVKTEDVSGDDSGATICIEWSGENGWIGGAYPAGVKGTSDWKQVEGITSPIPAEATSVSVTLYLRKGMTGRAWFDDVEIREYFGPPLAARVESPRYRGRVAAGPEAAARVGLAIAERLAGGRTLDQLQLDVIVTAAGGDPVARQTLRPEARQLSVDVPLAGLAAGDYRLVVRLLGADDGQELASFDFPLSLLAPDAPQPTVTIDGHGRTIVNGEPFFPLGFYDGRSGAEDLRRIAAAGYNCVMPYGINSTDLANPREYLDNAQAVGLKVIYSVKDFYDGTIYRPAQVGPWTGVDAMTRGVVETFRDHPALLAWYLNDELPLSYLPELTRRYETVRDLDPNHPCWIVLYQVGDLAHYTGTTDLLGTDPYPIPGRPPAMAGQWTRRTAAASGGRMNFWQVPQAHDWGNYRKNEEEKARTRAPSLDEMRCMSLACLAEGAGGLIFYSYFDLKKDKLGFDTRWADLVTLAAELRQVIPYVLSTEAPPDLALTPSDPEAVFCWAWRKGDEVLVVAANGGSEQDGVVTWKLPAGARPETVIGAAERIDASGIALKPTQSVAVRWRVP